MQSLVPATELSVRLEKFRFQMDLDQPDWELAVFFGKINLFYFTGTIQDGMVLIPRGDEAVFWVRKSYERAIRESHFSNIRSMRSFRDAAAGMKLLPKKIHIETEIVPVAMLNRFCKHFPCNDIQSLDLQISRVRAEKSPYELSLMEKSGEIHRTILEDKVPEILIEGMSEASFVTNLYSLMVEEGHHGVVRFGMFNAEIVVGQIGFGENSLYPTYFDGPGGSMGLSPAVPVLGSRTRRLKFGDLVFVDVGCGVDGYHTDKTMTYMYGKELPEDVIDIHHQCVDIQNKMAEMLKPGVKPSYIYETITSALTDDFSKNFMGYGSYQVKFLGHGIGLLVNEYPVIAKGFDEPLKEGMVLALEPKKGIAGVGMVGIENSFIVTSSGGRCITGDNPGLIPVSIK